VLAVMKRVGDGEFSADLLARARREVMTQAVDRMARLPDMTDRLVEAAVLGIPADHAARTYNATVAILKEDVAKAARQWLRREEARIVAVGQTEALKGALGGLGITPVTIAAEKGKGKKK
jgi:hypothetical protein